MTDKKPKPGHEKHNSVLPDHVIDVGRKYKWKAPLIRNPIDDKYKLV